MQKTYHWGIVGLGRIAHKFTHDLQKMPQTRLQGVAARDLSRALTFAAQYQVPYAYGSYAELVNCPELEVVYIATPHNDHAEWARYFLEKGIAVLVEKPFTINASESRSVIQTAQARQVFLMEALWTRFLPVTRHSLERIAAGDIGDVLSVKADFGFLAPRDPDGRLYNPNLGGGALLDIGVYTLFLAQLILGAPERILAQAHLGPTGVDEETSILLSYANGALANLHTAIRFGTKTEAFIYGTKGTLHWQSRWHEPTQMAILRENERPEFLTFEYDLIGYGYEIAEVTRCLEAGQQESPLWPLASTQLLMETLDAVRAQIGLHYPADEP